MSEWTPPSPIRIALISLGCAKNLVDSECMSQILAESGHQLVSAPDSADVLIVNTCGFIESAKQEAIETILQLADFKKPAGKADYLIVTGCLAQRYRTILKKEMPEVDEILGVSEYGLIAETIERLYRQSKTPPAIQSSPLDPRISHLRTDRQPSTVGHAYIKIAEGCSNHCSYCAIPGIRGPFVSRPFEDIVAEAAHLSALGFAELILIAQDTTRYGLDRTGRRELPRLLRAIASLEPVSRIRVLYVYADGITDELIRCMASEPKIAHYLDLPIQHASDTILKGMNRRDTQESIRDVIRRLREAMPDMVLRSTVMVGFPGETVREFQELMAFLKEIRFERLGCFIFSPEEDTPAFGFGPRVRRDVSRRREEQVMALQRDITLAYHERRIGAIIPVLLEEIDEDGIFYRGRSFAEAPEVDPVIRVAATHESVKLGSIVPVRLLTASEYEMTGETVL